MASRLTLAVQYLSIVWHLHRFRSTWMPLFSMVALNFLAGFVYLGIAFSFKEDRESRRWVAWYIVTTVEIAVTLGMSYFWKVLSFEGTHLISRMSLLTLIIIGEGIIVVCKNITYIVENVNSWSAYTPLPTSPPSS
jgi:low temperature requirement protein LtrA